MRLPTALKLPELTKNEKDQEGILRFLRQFIKVFSTRDKKVVEAINRNDIEIVTSAPSSEPDYGEGTLQLYKSGSTWRLYVYTPDGWVHFDQD